MNENIDALHKEGIVGMMISLHTFPIESEEEFEEKKKTVEELKRMEAENLNKMEGMSKNSKTKQARHNNK